MNRQCIYDAESQHREDFRPSPRSVQLIDRILPDQSESPLSHPGSASMSLTEAICAVSTPPEDRQQWGDWLEAGDAIAFLTANEQDDEFVVHATPGVA